jgi:dinuclear metal center YbgI/SA1388 family protein
MKIRDLTNHLESIAPLRFQESYDNAGLIVGDPNSEIKGIMVSLDATEAVIQDAIDQGCNILVSHHPIVFRGIKQFDQRNYVHRAVIMAIKNDIALYAIHTNLDNVLQRGVNQKIAQRLGMQDLSVLRPNIAHHSEDKHDVGSGIIGTWTGSPDPMDALKEIKVAMNAGVVRYTTLLDQPVQKVAICGGAGSFLLNHAIMAECDLFITADYKYHEFFDADNRILIADIGHYESEFFTIELLGEIVTDKFPNFAPHYTKVNSNPVNYL